MFKKKLRHQPPAVQLIVFVTIWLLSFVVGSAAAVFYMQTAAGVPVDQLTDFVKNDIHKYPNITFVANALSSILTFLLPAVLFAVLASKKPIDYLGGSKPRKGIQVLLVALMAFVLIFFVSPLATWMKELNLGNTSKALDEQRDKMLSAYLSASDTITTIRNVILIALIPAICEECFFRGVFMKMLYSFVPKWWFSIGVSALIFAGFHSSITEFLPICLAGIILGTVYYLTSSLWLSILLHFIFNGSQVLIQVLSGTNGDKSMANNNVLITLCGISIIILLALMQALFKNKTPLPNEWNVYEPEVIKY